MIANTKKEEIRVVNLRNCPETILVLAQWFEYEFGNEGVTKENEKIWLEQSIRTNDRLPITLVAYAGDIPVGTARVFN